MISGLHISLGTLKIIKSSESQSGYLGPERPDWHLTFLQRAALHLRMLLLDVPGEVLAVDVSALVAHAVLGTVCGGSGPGK